MQLCTLKRKLPKAIEGLAVLRALHVKTKTSLLSNICGHRSSVISKVYGHTISQVFLSSASSSSSIAPSSRLLSSPSSTSLRPSVVYPCRRSQHPSGFIHRLPIHRLRSLHPLRPLYQPHPLRHRRSTLASHSWPSSPLLYRPHLGVRVNPPSKFTSLGVRVSPPSKLASFLGVCVSPPSKLTSLLLVSIFPGPSPFQQSSFRSSTVVILRVVYVLSGLNRESCRQPHRAILLFLSHYSFSPILVILIASLQYLQYLIVQPAVKLSRISLSTLTSLSSSSLSFISSSCRLLHRLSRHPPRRLARVTGSYLGQRSFVILLVNLVIRIAAVLMNLLVVHLVSSLAATSLSITLGSSSVNIPIVLPDISISRPLVAPPLCRSSRRLSRRLSRRRPSTFSRCSSRILFRILFASLPSPCSIWSSRCLSISRVVNLTIPLPNPLEGETSTSSVQGDSFRDIGVCFNCTLLLFLGIWVHVSWVCVQSERDLETLRHHRSTMKGPLWWKGRDVVV